MTKKKNINRVKITYIGSFILIIAAAAALLWSISLVTRGVWRLTHYQEIQKDRAEESTVDNFAKVANVPQGSFRYGGSPAWAKIRLLVDSAIQAERPEFQLRYVRDRDNLSNRNNGFEMLLNGQLSFLQSSFPLQERDYKRAELQDFKLKQIPVAIDAIAVAVNSELNIPGLTVEQLKSIYSGKIVNWQEVGGPDLEIVTYSLPFETGGMVEFFIEYVLGSQELGTEVKLVSSTTEALRLVADTPGAIYYGSASLIVPQCSIKPLPIGLVNGELIAPYRDSLVLSNQCPPLRNQININAFKQRSYPLTRYLYVIFKENGSIEEEAAIAYANLLLTKQGQELIAKAGLVPVRR